MGYTVWEKTPSWPILDSLLTAAGYTDFDGTPGSASAFLWRPRWGRLEPFGGGRLELGATVPEAQGTSAVGLTLVAFVRSVLIRVALEGAGGLSREHGAL